MWDARCLFRVRGGHPRWVSRGGWRNVERGVGTLRVGKREVKKNNSKKGGVGGRVVKPSWGGKKGAGKRRMKDQKSKVKNKTADLFA